MIDPADAANKPPCGGPGPSLSDDVKTLLRPLLAIIGTIGSVAGLLTRLTKLPTSKSPPDWYVDLSKWLLETFGITLSAAAIVAVAAYIAIQSAVITVFGMSWRSKCRGKTSGIRSCVSGVVNAVHDATIPPLLYSAQHPHVDLVVKSSYWNEFDHHDRHYVYCSDTGPRGLRSPIMKVFFRSDRVCKVLAAAFIGSCTAPLVAILAFNGIVATTGAMTFVGSLAFFAFALLFWLAALVAGIVAAAIAAAVTDDTAPEADVVDPEDEGGQASPGGHARTTSIAAGDLLTVRGPVAIDGNFRKSVVMRFAESAAAIGSLAGVEDAPYTHEDADAAIPPEIDVCAPARPAPEEEDAGAEPEPDLPDVPPVG